MLRTYRYRLYPTAEQQTRLDEIWELARWLHNQALAYCRKRWRKRWVNAGWNESRTSVTYDEQARRWRDWRNEQPDDNPLGLLNMTAGQQVLCRLDRAYREFVQGKRGKPRLKSKPRFNTLSDESGDGAVIKEGNLYVRSGNAADVARW